MTSRKRLLGMGHPDTKNAMSPLFAVLLGSVAAATVTAQDPLTPPPTTVQSAATAPINEYQLDGAGTAGVERGDYYETHVQGSFRFTVPRLGLTIRGENLLILNDLEATRERLFGGNSSGLPTRSIPSPSARRRLSLDAIRARLHHTLKAVGKAEAHLQGGLGSESMRLFRYLYCEGGVVVVQHGVEVMRCDRMWISPIDNRVVVENAELRYITSTDTSQHTLVVRGPRLVKQGSRWVGSNLVLTTCTASEPHAALAVEEAEIIEREGEFEVISRGQTLQISGVNTLPLPNARIFTGSQSEFPIKSIRAGYSSRLGAQLGVVFGLPFNATGGALHNTLTGRPASEFRGEWELGLGWIQNRGFPIEGGLTYKVPGLYEGRTEAYYLNDTGENIREIKRNLDGSLIDNSSRGVIRTENRFHIGEQTHVDVVAFHATDAAAYSEFFIGPYRSDEVPETSTYLHHADGNHLITIGTRFNQSDFSYRADRYLATRFIEELPVMTYQWLAQPIAHTPWETPIVVDLETQVGQRRSDYDDRAGIRVSDRSLRIDQSLEFSAPFHVGSFNFRPYVSGRGTFYDDTPSGEDEDRLALEGGFQIGTRLSRTWSWMDQGKRDSLRHVIAPRLTYRNRFDVDQDPSSFFRYDDVDPTRLRQLGYEDIDLLTERELVRFEVRNLVQKMVDGKSGRQPRDFIYVDLAQDFLPHSSRDNDGEAVGLLFYDWLLRPSIDWLPLDNFAVAFFGDMDWQHGMQTMDVEMQFGEVLGINWSIDYREDAISEGALRLAGRTKIYDRWSVYGSAQRDLEQSEWLSYVFGMQRNDHDWSIALSAAYNPFVNETTFRVEFLPSFGAGNSLRRDRFGINDLRNNYAARY